MEVTKSVQRVPFASMADGQLSQAEQDAYRVRANQIASTVFSRTSLLCDEELDQENMAPRVSLEVSASQLENLRLTATKYPDLSMMVCSLEALMGWVDPKIETIDFSNGYEEDVRNQADYEEMAGLFDTFVTIQKYFEQRCEYLEEDRKSRPLKKAFKRWFEAVMSNLVIRLLREVAKNNQDSRRGQLTGHPQISPMRAYICSQIGALDEEGNPQGWKTAAIAELEKFFHFERVPQSQSDLRVMQLLGNALTILRQYP